jgi:hypothetical protein
MMKTPYYFRRQRQSSAVLVITLCMLVLVSIVVLAFFSQTLVNRQMSFSSGGQERAQIVALSALDVLQGDLISEMEAGSTTNTVSGQTLFFPSANTTMVPASLTDVSGINNLITWSGGGSNLWPADAGYSAGGPVLASSDPTDNTTHVSLNGRYIATNRWSEPDFGPYLASATPSWVLLSRSGVLTAANATANLSTLGTSTATNANYVVGRFAYAIYDESGLIDVAAGGYPSSVSNSPPAMAVAAGKQSEGYADLSQIITNSADVDTLVNFRNLSSASSPTNYTTYLNTFAPQYGFLRAEPGDNAFASRQDLIQYWTNNLSSETSTNLLQYFTTFSREKNAPSWAPLLDASAMGGQNNGVNTTNSLGTSINNEYAYADNATNIGTVNRNLYDVRVTTPFTRLDGTKAVVGEPLIKERFDLSKLSWITYNGALPTDSNGNPLPGISTNDIYNYFGLKWNAPTSSALGFYSYNHGNPGAGIRIMTLDEVATAGREPDFFELLQAGILQGGLGLCTGDPSQSGSYDEGGEFYQLAHAAGTPPLSRGDVNGYLVYAQAMYQVIQIGVNIIDQATADNYPTDISLNGEDFYGDKDLPYINGITQTVLRPAPGAGTSVGAWINNHSLDHAWVHQWLCASLWNPHQNAATPPTPGPTTIRLIAVHGTTSPYVYGLTPITTFPKDVYGYTYTTNKPSWVSVKLSDYTNFTEPASMDPSLASLTDSAGDANQNTNGLIITQLGWRRAGIYQGYSYSPDNTNIVPDCYTDDTNSYATTNIMAHAVFSSSTYTPSTALTLELQYQDSAGAWHAYEELRGVVNQRQGAFSPFFEPTDPEWQTMPAAGKVALGNPPKPPAANQDIQVWNLLDPRAPRFNMPGISGNVSASTYYTNVESIAGQIGPNFDGTANPAQGGNETPTITDAWGYWMDNLSAYYISYYTDRDFVNREGDAAGWSDTGTPKPNPLVPGNSAGRPVMLCRPFRSVAEMGYAFRDEPWKTLNFMSTKSADLGLLDLFCIDTATTTAPPPSMVAGKVDINSAPEPVLQALIAGAERDTGATNIISSADAQTLADNVTNFVTTNGPLMNIAQIPGALPQNTSTSTVNPGNKAQREALIRALSDNTSTRTWNLMIDVIAQSGRFKQNPGSLGDFVVDGEKRYWLHVAIDRFTGQIIDQQLEPVQER